MSNVTPKIDDQYWFEFSKTLIDSAITRREKAAETLQKLVVWLWGIYTASAAIGFSLSGKQLDFWPTIIIAAASGALVLVYWGTVWVQIPELVTFDPRSPTEIKQVFTNMVKNRNKRLVTTLFGSVVAAVLVSTAIVLASISTSPAPPTPPSLPTIQAILTQDGSESLISVTAKTGKATLADLRVTYGTKDKTETMSPVAMKLIPTDDGLIQTSIRIKTKIQSAQVQLTWADKNGTTFQLAKDVEEESRTTGK